jgi:hypothetical protein
MDVTLPLFLDHSTSCYLCVLQLVGLQSPLPSPDGRAACVSGNLLRRYLIKAPITSLQRTYLSTYGRPCSEGP